ncbi:MAG: peptidoglycan DD-metalloendopeptidase family protein [Eubacterium sp.]
MSSDSKSKNAGRNLKALFSVVCVSIIALGVIVYFTTKPAKDVNEPTTVVETTAVQRSVTVEDTTAEETTPEQTTAEQTTKAEDATMPLLESNTPYKSFYQYPLDEVVINSYSEELIKNETMGDYRSHTAVDFGAEQGAEVRSVNDGIVLDVYNDSMLGMVVEIDHGGKLVARYCGLDSVSVSKGDEVKIGQQLGTLGAVPFEASLDSHLHFETRLDGKYVDPLSVMGKTE